jgi:hypothetical protein
VDEHVFYAIRPYHPAHERRIPATSMLASTVGKLESSSCQPQSTRNLIGLLAGRVFGFSAPHLLLVTRMHFLIPIPIQFPTSTLKNSWTTAR